MECSIFQIAPGAHLPKPSAPQREAEVFTQIEAVSSNDHVPLIQAEPLAGAKKVAFLQRFVQHSILLTRACIAELLQEEKESKFNDAIFILVGFIQVSSLAELSFSWYFAPNE